MEPPSPSQPTIIIFVFPINAFQLCMFTKNQEMLYSPLADFILCFFLLVTTIFFLKWIFTFPKHTQRTLPPSPPKLPLLGNLHQLGSFPHRSLQSLSLRHGSLMLLHLGTVPVLVGSSAEVAREIMKTHDLAFSDRPKSGSIANRLLYSTKDVSTAPYGEYWRQIRSISVIHLLSNRRVPTFGGVRRQETDLMIQTIRDSAEKVMDLSELMMKVTNDVVCRAALGRKYSDEEEGIRFREMLDEFTKLLGVFNLGDFVPCMSWVNRLIGLDDQVERVFREFDDFLEHVIEEHEKFKEGDHGGSEEHVEDFVDVLLKILRKNTVGFAIDRDSIKSIILDAFAAGTDTTFTVLEWAMSELFRHPHAMKKLQAEIRDTALTEDTLQKMQYLKAVIKETLRLHPPIPLLVPRRLIHNVKLQDYDIPAGTMTIVNAWAIGRDCVSWGEDAEKFLPERFLKKDVDFRGLDFELIPFGSGRRGCPGMAFAMATVEVVLASLVREFDWGLGEGVAGEDLDMAESGGLSIHRKNPLLAIATQRY